MFYQLEYKLLSQIYIEIEKYPEKNVFRYPGKQTFHKLEEVLNYYAENARNLQTSLFVITDCVGIKVVKNNEEFVSNFVCGILESIYQGNLRPYLHKEC